MKVLLKNRGVIIFYILLVAFTYVCSWRFERLDEKPREYVNEIVLNVK
jgi:hypothetical protein